MPPGWHSSTAVSTAFNFGLAVESRIIVNELVEELGKGSSGNNQIVQDISTKLQGLKGWQCKGMCKMNYDRTEPTAKYAL